MGDEATRRHASPGEQYEMERLLAEGLAAGGMGFSSSWATTHNDDEGDPVPSRHASMDELIALCKVVSGHEGTTLEFIPTIGLFEEHDMELMTRMSLAANRPLNWNVLQVNSRSGEVTENKLGASDYASSAAPACSRSRSLTRSVPASRSAPASCSTCSTGGPSRWPCRPTRRSRCCPTRRGGASSNEMAQQTDGPARGIAYWQVFTVAEVFTPSTRAVRRPDGRRDRGDRRQGAVGCRVRHHGRRRAPHDLHPARPRRRR